MTAKPATPALDALVKRESNRGHGDGTSMHGWYFADHVRAAYEADLLADRSAYEAEVRADERRKCFEEVRAKAEREYPTAASTGAMYSLMQWAEHQRDAAKPAEPEGTKL